jgi:hypothetical protein
MQLQLSNALGRRGVLAAITAAVAGLVVVTTGAAASAQPTSGSARPASAASVDPRIGGVFNPITNFRTGKCLEPEGASTAEFARIVEVDCATKPGPDADAQGWAHHSVGTNHYTFLNQRSGLCFDAFDGAFNGARLLQGTCKAISNEEFNTGTRLPATTKIEARPGFKDSGFCLDVLSDLTQVAFFQCGSSPSQTQTWGIPGQDL